MNFINKFSDSLKKTRESLTGKISFLLKSAGKIDDDLYDEIEEILITGDIGVETAVELIEKLRIRVATEKISEPEKIYTLLEEEILKMLFNPQSGKENVPHIILIVGVNGTGKTTSIGKLANKLSRQNKKVLLAAADTYRAAAIEQLTLWAEKIHLQVISHATGSDPSAVVFDAVTAAKARNVDYLIIDTAGRLHTKTNLMNELDKINRTIKKIIPEAPHETLLVLDATTGQNAIMQAKEFAKVTPLDGIILSKIDGTAKGGVVIGISNELQIPVKYLGMGEKIDDLEDFDKESFVRGLFK